jgi:deazaflavin-dependent oxidoreductase (nitroreductase family)
MYRGGRPDGLARALNGAWARQFAAGRLAPKRGATLEVTGRRSGRTISLPVMVADHEGQRYLVSMLGNDANWVRNVRAADRRAVLRHGVREEVRLDEVDVGARAPLLRRYLEIAPGARPHIPVDRRAPLADFEGIAAQFPVFRITSVGSSADGAPENPVALPSRAPLELSAHMTVRPGQLDGFKKQAAECVRVTRERDTRTLRYDWFLTDDGTECEVREAYLDAQGLIEHRSHVGEALAKLFKESAANHFMTVYGEASPELLDLAQAHHMTGHMKWFSFLEGLPSEANE